MRDNSRRQRNPLVVAFRERLKGGGPVRAAALQTATAASAAARAAPHQQPSLRQRRIRQQAHHQILSDQLYETAHPLIFASPAASSRDSASGDSLMLGVRGPHAAMAITAGGSSSVSTVPESSDSGDGGGGRRPHCDCDFCQRVATATFTPDVALAKAGKPSATGPRRGAAAGAWSDVSRGDTIDWYNVSDEIEAAAAAAAAATATLIAPQTVSTNDGEVSDAPRPPLPAPQPMPQRALAAAGDSTREFFGDDVRILTQASSAVATAAVTFSDTSTPQQVALQPPPPSSPMPPYSRQLLARLLAEPSPTSTATNANTSELFDSFASVDSVARRALAAAAVRSPLLHNSPQLSELDSPELTDCGAPVNSGLADLDCSPLSGSVLTNFNDTGVSASSSSLMSATLPMTAKAPLRHPLSSVDRCVRSPSMSSYKSSLVPSSAESSLSGHRAVSFILTPPPGFGSPAADVTVVAVADDSRCGSGSGGFGPGLALRRRVRRQLPLVRRTNAFSRKLID